MSDLSANGARSSSTAPGDTPRAAPTSAPQLASPPRVLVFGASIRAAVQSLQRAGCAAWGADLFADVDLLALAPTVRIARYPQGFAAAAERLPRAPWMYVGGLENSPALLDRLARRSPLLGNPGDVCRQVRAPRRLQAVLSNLGSPLPEMRRSPPPPAEATAWLWKPRRSSGGLGVGRPVASPPRRDGYFQRFVAGTPLGATFISSPGAGVRLAGVARQLCGPSWGEAPGYAYGGSIGPIPVDAARREQLESIGRILTAEFRLAGLWGLDFLDDGQSLWPLEVNPRYTASVEVLELATCSSLVVEHLRAFGFAPPTTPPLSLPPDSCCGKVVVYATHDTQVTRPLFARLAQLQCAAQAADIPPPGALISADTPLCTLFAWGPTEDDVAAKLREKAREVGGMTSEGGRRKLLGDVS